MPLTKEQTDWAFTLLNDPSVYPDEVEQILDIKYDGPNVYVIAIDNGNPPIVPLKQLAFKFTYEDETYQELTEYAFQLLNPDEVEGNASRPQQFAAHLPVDYWAALILADWTASEDCECSTPGE